MFTPKTPQQTILAWIGACILSLLIAFTNSMIEQLSSPGPTDWEVVALDLFRALATLIPVVATGLGLPIIGKELQTRLINRIGSDNATEILKDAAAGTLPIKHEIIIDNSVDLEVLARELLKAIKKESENEQNK